MINIYVLELENNKYYIGDTFMLSYGLDDYLKDNVIEWTKNNKPISVCKFFINKTEYDIVDITLEYIEKYGIDNVRCSKWTDIILYNKDMVFNKSNIKCKNCNQPFNETCCEFMDDIFCCLNCNKDFYSEKELNDHLKHSCICR